MRVEIIVFLITYLALVLQYINIRGLLRRYVSNSYTELQESPFMSQWSWQSLQECISHGLFTVG